MYIYSTSNIELVFMSLSAFKRGKLPTGRQESNQKGKMIYYE